MLALKINITKFIKQEERDRIFKYSKSLAECYNLALTELKSNNNFNAIHPLTKKFQNEHKEIYSKHAQNCGRDAISAVKSFFKLRKVEPTAKYPKHNRKYSTITLDANKQTRMLKSGEIITSLGGGFKFIKDKVIKFTYPEMLLDLSSCNYFDSNKINKESIKQIVISIKDGNIYACFVYLEPKQEEKVLNNEFISIDLGISAIASIYSSKGECFKYQTKRMKSLEKNKDKIKSLRDRKKKYSKHWNKLNKTLKKKQKKITNKRNDYLHKASKHIINYCISNNIDNIIIGDIETKKLVTKKEEFKELNYKQKKIAHSRNKSTQNEGLLSRFKSFINYKALNKRN
jgi:putative transposase